VGGGWIYYKRVSYVGREVKWGKRHLLEKMRDSFDDDFWHENRKGGRQETGGQASGCTGGLEGKSMSQQRNEGVSSKGQSEPEAG